MGIKKFPKFWTFYRKDIHLKVKFQIEINMDNAAFNESPNIIELNRILIELTKELSKSCQFSSALIEDQSYLSDINGNIIGFWKITD
jgi:hypothetical protein